MVTQQTAIKMINSFIDDMKSTGLHVRKVILFGSIAKNKQHEYSDIDLAIVADEFEGVGFIDIPLFINSLVKYHIISPKTFSTQDFLIGDAFVDEIKKTGIEIEV